MANGSLFGTSGIRGDAEGLFTSQFCFDITQAFIQFLKNHDLLGPLAVGYDPRPSSPRIKDEILNGLSEGKITEGHTRPILMLADHPEEQLVLFKEIVYKKITVREAERLARKIAYDRVRKKEFMPDPEITELEEEFQEKLGTRVHIDRKELGGQIKIDFFSTDDLRTILELIKKSEVEKKPIDMLKNHLAQNAVEKEETKEAMDDRTIDEVKQDDTDLYNISNFSV